MKKILILLILLSSCATNKLLTTTTVVNGDTISKTEYVSLPRQERLAIKDSLKHEIKKAKVERLVIRDSIRFEYKTKWVEKTRYKDSIRWTVKEKKVDNKHDIKLKKKSNWWVWMLVGSIATLIIIFIFKR